jgi:hypothetical protein
MCAVFGMPFALSNGVTMLWCTIGWLIFTLGSAAAAIDFPTTAELHRAVIHHAESESARTNRWRRRVRWAALLPRLQVGVRHTLRDALDLNLQDKVSVSGSGVVIGPRASDFQERTDRNLQFDVRAIWSLQELAFNPDAILVSREARARRKEIRARLSEANRFFARWQQLWRRRAVRGKLALERMFLQSELDALTGGWFSRRVEQP